MILHTGHDVTIEAISEVQALPASLRGRFGTAPARLKMALSKSQQAVAGHPWPAIRSPFLRCLCSEHTRGCSWGSRDSSSLKRLRLPA